MANPIISWEAPTKAAASDVRQTIIDMLFVLGNLRVAHWQASTKTNEHAALGELYSSINDRLDTLAETLMGDEKNRDMPSKSAAIGSQDGYESLVTESKTLADRLCKSLASPPDLANIAAEIRQAANKAAYLLLS